MNNLERVKQKEEMAPNLEFGLSTMYAGIRLIENVLDIGSKRDRNKWYIIETKDKETMKNSKQRICKEFEEKMGYIVNQPKQRSGN